MRWLFAGFARRLFVLVMLLGSAVITAASVSYFDFETLPPFVIEKLPVHFETLWLTSLRIHVASALVSFPLCLVLTTRFLQRRRAWHRWLGRATGALVLFALVPSGVVLSFEAKGGAVVTVGFLLSAAIVAGCSVWGIRAARRHDLPAHARAMRHVVAQMSVAVTSRALLVGLDMAGADPNVAYVVALWVPLLASAAVAELVASSPRLRVENLVHLAERMLRETSKLGLVVRVCSVVRPVARLGR